MTHCKFARIGAYAGFLLLFGCAHGGAGTERAPRFSAKLIANIRMTELDQGQCSMALGRALEVGDAALDDETSP